MDRRVKERLVGATILVVLIVLIVPELLSGPKARVTPAQTPTTGTTEAVRNVTVDLTTSKATPAENAATENTAADNAAASTASPSAQSTPTATGGADSGDAGRGNPGPGNTAPGNEASGDATAPAETLGAAETVPGESAGGTPAAGSRGNRRSGPPSISTLKAQQPAHSAGADIESEPSTPRLAPQAPKPGNANAASSAGTSNHRWAVQLGSFASRANAEKLVRQIKPHDATIYMSPSGTGAAVRYRVRIGPLADRDAAERMVAKLKKEGQAASLVPP